MSCNYADGLSPYENKGKLGLAEKFDPKDELVGKVKTLANWISAANHVVVHTGAGISTSAGIPDFRGPNGVWTLEAQGKRPDMNISFNDALPTKTHMALLKLVNDGKVKYIVSQNIDGLHLRSGLPRSCLAELHGNMFVEQCNKCSRQFVRSSATSSVGKKCLQKSCPTSQMNRRPCRGRMHDTILDWEHDLPERDLGLADFHSCVADLSICLGTTLQIVPSGNLPLHTKKYGKEGKLVICNLQPTKHDRKADLLINGYVDDVIELLMENLKTQIPEYTREKDPIHRPELAEWTIPARQVAQMRAVYEERCCKLRTNKAKGGGGRAKGQAPQDGSSGEQAKKRRKSQLEEEEEEQGRKQIKTEEEEGMLVENRSRVKKEDLPPSPLNGSLLEKKEDETRPVKEEPTETENKLHVAHGKQQDFANGDDKCHSRGILQDKSEETGDGSSKLKNNSESLVAP